MNVSIDRFGVIFTFFIFVSIYTYRIYRKSDVNGKSAIIKIILFSVLLLVPSAAKLSLVPGWMQVPLIVGPQYYGAFLAYLAIDQIINNKFYQPIIKNRFFSVVVILHITTLILGYLIDDVQIDFADTGIFPHNWTYYAFVFFDYFTMLYITSNIVTLCWMNLRRRKVETSFGIRCFLLFVCCLFGLLSFILVEINLALSVFYTDNYHNYINQIYHDLRLMSYIFLILSFFLPRYIISKIARIINGYINNKKERQIEWLSYLHQKLSQIVPGVVLSYGDLHIEDMLIEIADALIFIRSCNHSTMILSPELEANDIFRLLKNNIVIQEAGKNSPPPAHYHEVKYSIALAKHLKRLEERS